MSHDTQLWHGSDDIRYAYTNGAGFYVSFDLRLARYFEKNSSFSTSWGRHNTSKSATESVNESATESLCRKEPFMPLQSY